MKPEFIETVGDLGLLLDEGGAFESTSDHQAYGVLKALAWYPGVSVVEEFSGDTAVVRAFIEPDTGLLRNPDDMEAMGYDPRYFTGLLDGYLHWEIAWWREVIQNARDAVGPNAPDGPRNIDLVCRVESYTDVDGVMQDAVRVECSDDGNGMDEQTLRNAFLMFGGSMKPPGGFGGFGDAKGLIILPWLGYEIHTTRVLARGRHNRFKIEPASEARRGTRVTVWMPLQKATTPESAAAFVERCNLPGVRIRVNSKVVKAGLEARAEDILDGFPMSITVSGGKKVGVIAAYHSPRAKRQGVYVRQTDDRGRSVFMFEKPIYSSKFKGLVLVELYGSPRVLFDQKRNSLNYATNTSEIVEQFLQRLIVDSKSALKRVKGRMRAVFGEQALEVRQGLASKVAAEMAMDVSVDMMKKYATSPSVPVETFGFTDDQIDVIEQKLSEMPETSGGVGIDGSPDASDEVVRRAPKAVAESLRSTRFLGPSAAAEAIRLTAWQPVFMLVNEVDFFVLPKKLQPGSMAQEYKDLATVWTELCRFVLLRLGWSRTFGVGFIFEWDPRRDSTALAAYTSDAGTTDAEGRPRTETGTGFLLLNPVKLSIEKREYDSDGEVKSIKYKEEVRWDLRDRETVKGLCAMAVHEATHMVSGISQHDESFASALTDNMATMMDMMLVAQKIVESVIGAPGEKPAKRRTSKRGNDPEKVRAELMPESLRDPAFYRLWALFLAVRMELPTLDAEQIARVGATYGKLLAARVSAHPDGVRHLWAIFSNDIERTAPDKRGPVSASFVRPLTEAGQRAWSGFVDAVERGARAPAAGLWEDPSRLFRLMLDKVTESMDLAEFAKKAKR